MRGGPFAQRGEVGRAGDEAEIQQPCADAREAAVAPREEAHFHCAADICRVGEVRLQRQSGQAGQRFDSLKTLTQLARAWPRSDAATLRTEIGATLALPDLRQTRRWTAPHVAVNGTEAFSDDLRFYAAAVEAGIALYETRSQKVVRVWPHPRASAAHELVFSPTAAWLGVRFDDNHWELFATGSERPPVQASAPVAFHSDGQGFFTVREGQGLFLVTLADEKERRILPPPVLLDPLLPDRSGERVLVLVGKPPRAVIVRASDGAQLVNIPTIPDLITAADWSADGRWIALANGVPPYTVTLYDAGSGEQSARFNEHPMAVRKLRFHPDSRSFAAVSDGQKLIWRSVEPSGFRVAIEAGARALEFSLDGQQLGYSPEQGQLGLLEITEPAIFRAWDEPPPDGTGTAYSAALSPDGRWAAVASDKSLRVWDARARRSVAQQSHPLGRAWWSTVFFAPKDPAQIVWSMLGGGVWRAELNSAGQLSTPRRVGGAIDGLVQEFAADGRSLVVNVQPGPGQRAELWPEGDPARAHLLGSGIPFAGYRVVKEGHTGISTHFSEPDLWLWDTASGKRIRSLGLKEPVASEPSPDGRWLLTGTRSGHVLWNTSTWEAGARWPSRPGERDVWVAAFSPDSRMLAKASPAGEITLRRVPLGEELLTLIPPRGLRLQELKFTADGSHLLMLQASGRFYEWNLKDLHAELDKLALGW